MIWRARFWHDNDVLHVIDFTCDDPVVLDKAFYEAIEGVVLPPHDSIVIAPRAKQ